MPADRLRYGWRVFTGVVISGALVALGRGQEAESEGTGGGGGGQSEEPGEIVAGGEDVSLPVVVDGIGAIYQKCCLSVVSVRAKTEIGEGLTTGFLVGDGSLVATVFMDDTVPDSVEVDHDGETFPAKVVVMDERMRLALLEVEGLTGAPLVIEERTDGFFEIAERLYAITESANPLFRAVEGRIAGIEKLVRSRVLPVKLLRVNLTGPGEMVGAPLVSEQGNVVGVVVQGTPDVQTSFYALPAALVTKVYEDYKKTGRLTPGWLGIVLEEGTTTPRIFECKEGGPAAEVGLRTGDVILRVGRRVVREYQDVVDAMYFLRPNEPTEIEILRGLSRATVTVTPRVKPARAAEAEEEEEERE